MVTIAHRLVTVQDSDWIGYMQPRKAGAAPDSPEAKSQLLQTGPHSELMRSCPEYSAMVQAQAQAQEEGSPWDGDPEESLVREASGVSGHPPAEAEAVATVGSDDTKAKKEEEGKTKGAAQKSPMLRIARIRRMGRARGGGMPLLVCGVLAAVLDGLTWPATALLLVEVLQGFYESQGQRLEWKWSVILLGVGLWDFVWMACKVYCLHRDGEALTARLRTMLFRALVCQDMTFFDMPGNESGALGAMLASETSKIHVMWGNAIGAHPGAAHVTSLPPIQWRAHPEGLTPVSSSPGRFHVNKFVPFFCPTTLPPTVVGVCLNTELAAGCPSFCCFDVKKSVLLHPPPLCVSLHFA